MEYRSSPAAAGPDSYRSTTPDLARERQAVEGGVASSHSLPFRCSSTSVACASRPTTSQIVFVRRVSADSAACHCRGAQTVLECRPQLVFGQREAFA